MRLTNNLHLPQPLVDAVANDDYDAGNSDITVTQLLSPPQMVELIRRHSSELTEDASDRIYALMGKAIHNILERADRTGATEERLYKEVRGWQVSGQFDRMVYEHGHLSDYKIVSVYEVQNGLKVEKEQQLNLLAHLLRHNGKEVTKLEAVCVMRDWRKREAQRNPDYPQSQVAVIELPLWTDDWAATFMDIRVVLHQEARKVEDTGWLTECTEEERWAEPAKYAVMKPGNKRALRVLYSREAAEEWRAENNQKTYIEERPGESIRCSSYCLAGAAGVCPQWNAMQDARD